MYGVAVEDVSNKPCTGFDPRTGIDKKAWPPLSLTGIITTKKGLFMDHCDTLVRAGVCLTQNSEREVLQDAGIAVSAGRIRSIGPYEEAAATMAAGELVDLSRCLVMPGLINTHTHATMTVFRGLADDLPLMEWLTRHIFPVEKHLTAEVVHLGALLACAEMLRSGTTCFCDMYLMEREVARAVIESGMRAVVGEGLFTFPSPAYGDVESAFALVEELQEISEDEPRLRNALMPHAVYTTTPEILERSFALAEKYDTVWMIHLAETAHETAECVKTTGKRPLAYIRDLGLLSDRTLLAHGVDLNEEEIGILAATGTKVAHNPESNMKLASGIAPVPAMLRAGVTVGLGTDGAASNNNLNMFTEMASASLLHKAASMDPTALSAQSALDMATVHGASCLRWPEIGRLEQGCSADLVALSLEEPNMVPLHNPVSQAVYAANGGEVVLTMVAGKVLYSRGRYASIDYPGLLREMKGVAEWVRKRRTNGE
jgi:5-methylthioadenosine/S-adenosylhomocysteine deaminase